MSEPIEIGRVYVGHCPFYRETVDLWTGDSGEGDWGPVEVWRPGVEWERDDNGDADACAGGVGAILLTVVSVHKPGKYPTRVFYTRQWRDPDGKVFGKTNLRVTTQDAFRRMAKGWRHDFYLDGEVYVPEASHE